MVGMLLPLIKSERILQSCDHGPKKKVRRSSTYPAQIGIQVDPVEDKWECWQSGEV